MPLEVPLTSSRGVSASTDNNIIHASLDLRRQTSLSPVPTGLRNRSRSPSPLIEPVLADTTVKPSENKLVSWLELPRKDQLFIMTLIRLAEPITQTSLSAYMWYMLKSFPSNENASDAEIAAQAGVLSGSYTAAQCVTAVWWGRLADKEWMGRKNVLMIGLTGTLVSAVGFGFSRSFVAAMFFRLLGGALNGNVGVMRTMISEIIKEKKYQVKAFLMMPVTFNVGVLIGPLLGGWLQDPARTFPSVFGNVSWMYTYPYALPNLVTAQFLLMSVLVAFLGLQETHIDRQHRTDYGLITGKAIVRSLGRLVGKPSGTHQYAPISHEEEPDSLELQQQLHNLSPARETTTKHTPRPKLPVRRMFTRNLICTYITLAFFHWHVAAFNTLWFLFLATPRFDPQNPQPPWHTSQHLPFSFTGGLGLPPPTIGLAIGIMGGFGLVLQFGVYPTVVHHVGLVRTFRSALLLYAPVYALSAFLPLIPTSSPPPAAANGPYIWISIAFLLLIFVLGRTFALPIIQILVNNSSPHPSVLGSVHGIGLSVSTGARTVGPIVYSWLYGVGLDHARVWLAWWVLSGASLIAFVLSLIIYEGSGHEIRLEGDPDPESVPE